MNQLVFIDRTLFITIKSEKKPRPSNKKCTLKTARTREREKEKRSKKVMTCAYT